MGTEVHIWFESVDERACSDELLETLDAEEVARAGTFRLERDRVRFMARRAFRRRVLARYLETEPGSIRIRTSPAGQPALESPDELTFSTSHSDGLAVVAVARERRVGVDLERIRPLAEAQELADRLFSPHEADHLRSVGETAKARTFLTLWTRKESVVKALGIGLSMRLDGFEVLDGDEAAAVRPGVRAGGLPFALTTLDGIPGYVGAVAVSGTEVVALRLCDAATPS